MVAQLIQIYYDDDQLKHLYPFARPYKNEKLTVFFENEVISRLVMQSKAKKISVCSWRLREKMRMQVKPVAVLTQDVMNSDYEVLSFTNNSPNHRMLAAAEVWHKGFVSTFDMMLNKIGITRPFDVREAIYQNHFAARREIYKDYILNYLRPAMNVIMNDKELNMVTMADSGYTTLAKKDPEFIRQKIGIPYYPLVPFLLERLFSVYCQNKKIRITFL